jgi:hypothetical protein
VTEIRKLIKAYEHQESVTELGKRFGIHRLTVTALLRRHGVESAPGWTNTDRDSGGRLVVRSMLVVGEVG